MFLVDYMTLELGLILIPIILSFIAQAGVDSAYTKGNKIRVTFNGMVETSNPAQIGAYKIELIKKINSLYEEGEK